MDKDFANKTMYVTPAKNMEDMMKQLENVSDVQSIASSSDGGGASKYFVPKGGDLFQIKQILFVNGVKYDVHNSNLYKQDVIRVKAEDLQPMNRLETLAEIQSIAVSGGVKEPVKYLIPKGPIHVIESILEENGVKFDIHKSSLYNQNVIKVKEEDFNLLKNATNKYSKGLNKLEQKNKDEKGKQGFMNKIGKLFSRE